MACGSKIIGKCDKDPWNSVNTYWWREILTALSSVMVDLKLACDKQIAKAKGNEFANPKCPFTNFSC